MMISQNYARNCKMLSQQPTTKTNDLTATVATPAVTPDEKASGTANHRAAKMILRPAKAGLRAIKVLRRLTRAISVS